MTSITEPSNTEPNTRTITGLQLIEKVREIATRFPDHVSDCYYITEACGTPSEIIGCIMGQALHELGVPDSVLQEVEDMMESKSINMPNIKRHFNILASSLETNWLKECQRTQDKGLTWSESVWEADDTYPFINTIKETRTE